MHRCCGENLEGPLFNILLSRLQTSIKFNEAKSFFVFTWSKRTKSNKLICEFCRPVTILSVLLLKRDKVCAVVGGNLRIYWANLNKVRYKYSFNPGKGYKIVFSPEKCVVPQNSESTSQYLNKISLAII